MDGDEGYTQGEDGWEGNTGIGGGRECIGDAFVNCDLEDEGVQVQRISSGAGTWWEVILDP